MLVFADSYGSHNVNYRDFNNQKNNRQMNKTFKMRLKKNGNDFADVAVNENGKYYYRKFNNLQNFFQKLNDNDNSIFQLAKNNNSKTQKRKISHIKLIKKPNGKITSTIYKHNLKKPLTKKQNVKKQNVKKQNVKKQNVKKQNVKKRK